MNLDHDLRRALRRTPAPPHLAHRVLARLEQPHVVPAATSRAPAVRRLAVAAAIALTAVGGAEYYRRQQTVAEAERVQKDIRLALQITGETLALVQRKLQEPQP